jgi:tetratricopeptide (TPR) repeat protein
LDDLKEPVGERHAPWFFTLREWVPEKTIRELVARITPATKRGNAAIRQATERFFRDHPEVRGLIPLLLDRGDPVGREFALHLASGLDAPDMKSALRDFALGTRGPDAMRLQAAQYAMRAGLIPSGNITFYTKGEWQEVLLLDMELTGEPSLHLRPAAQALVKEAHAALSDDEPERAEELLLQADALQPDEPSIRHNLAMALEMQGRRAEAEALLRENHARHPEYLFSRCVLARLAIKQKHYAVARDLLEPLMLQKRFHYSEFAAFAGAQIDLLLAEGQREGAKMWFDMWSSVDPDNPQLEYFRAQFSPLGRFLRR